jgi:hypothetical protein
MRSGPTITDHLLSTDQGLRPHEGALSVKRFPLLVDAVGLDAVVVEAEAPPLAWNRRRRYFTITSIRTRTNTFASFAPANSALPHIPPGFRYATFVTVIHRTGGVADGQHRRIIAVCGAPS